MQGRVVRTRGLPAEVNIRSTPVGGHSRFRGVGVWIATSEILQTLQEMTEVVVWRGTMSATCAERNLAVLNYDELVERCVGNIEFAERVLAKFQYRFGEDLEQLERELEQQNGDEIARLAHRAKGASASVSAGELCKRAADVERLGREQRLTEIPSGLKQLREAWARFVNVTHESGLVESSRC